MIGDPYRRRRRRWWLLVPALVVVAVGALYSGEGRGAEVVEAVHRETEKLAAVAAPYRDMLASVGGLGRLELAELTSDVLGALDAAAAAAEVEGLPPELAGTMDGYRLAVGSWTSGVTAFRDAVLAAADSPVPAEELLADALLDLRAGDRLYARFLERAAAPELPRPILPYPEIAFLPDPFPIVSGSQSIAAAARQPGGPLAVVRSVAIEQVTTEPAWVLDTEGVLVAPETESLVFKVLVANTGNTDSEATSLTLSLRTSTGVDEVSARVDGLAAASSSTVTMPAVGVVPGASYEVAVVLGAAEGDDPADNSRVVAFRVNGPTPATTAAG